MLQLMTRLVTAAAAILVMSTYAPLRAQSPTSDIEIADAYARFMPGAMAGAAFMEIINSGSQDDRLIGVASQIAKKVETHTHEAGSDGMMQMRHVPDGFVIPAGGRHKLERGADHIMFMGLDTRPVQGDTVLVELIFEKAGTIEVTIPVDNKR